MIRRWGLAFFLSFLSSMPLVLSIFFSPHLPLYWRKNLWFLKVLPAGSYFQSFPWRLLMCFRWGYCFSLWLLPSLVRSLDPLLSFSLPSNPLASSPSISLSTHLLLCTPNPSRRGESYGRVSVHYPRLGFPINEHSFALFSKRKEEKQKTTTHNFLVADLTQFSCTPSMSFFLLLTQIFISRW